MRTLDRLFVHKKITTVVYLVSAILLAVTLITFIGKDVFPKPIQVSFS